MAPPRHVTVVGAGLTGLTTAYRLSHLLPPSSHITLLEASARVGGWIKSTRHAVSLQREADGDGDREGKAVEGEVMLESGSRSFRPKGSRGAPKMLKLIQELGLSDSIIPIPTTHPAAKNRFILHPSASAEAPPRLVKVGLDPFSPSPLIRNLPWSVIREALTPSNSTAKPKPAHPTSGHHNADTDTDESVDAFLLRRFGRSTADLASAMMHGIYAASPAQLSARAVLGRVYDAAEGGGVVRGLLGRAMRRARPVGWAETEADWADPALGDLSRARKEWSMYLLRGGLQVLPDRLREACVARGVDIRYRTTVDKLDYSGPERVSLSVRYAAETEAGQREETLHPSTVVLALPPPFIAPLLPDLPFLAHQPRTSVGVVGLVFPLPPAQVHPDGFGYLIPRPSSADPGPSTPPMNPDGVLGVVFDSATSSDSDDPALRGATTKLTVMMGGPYWSSYRSSSSSSSSAIGAPLPRPSSAAALVGPALAHLRTVFPALRGTEPLIVSPQLHVDCIPTYAPGHVDRLGALHAAMRRSGLGGRVVLAGNGYGGIGVNDCVFSAETVSRAVAEGREVTGLESFLGDKAQQLGS